MLRYENKKIIMTEGDFGINLPITILCETGTIASDDSINFVIKDYEGENTIVEKKYTNILNNKFDLSFTKEESDKLKVGTYVYNIDWFKSDVFMNNILKNEIFLVEDK